MTRGPACDCALCAGVRRARRIVHDLWVAVKLARWSSPAPPAFAWMDLTVPQWWRLQWTRLVCRWGAWRLRRILARARRNGVL